MKTNISQPGGFFAAFFRTLSGVCLNLTLFTNKGHGERTVGPIRIVVGVLFAILIFFVTTAASISAPDATAQEIIWGKALGYCVPIFTLCLGVGEWIRLYQAETKGKHYLSRADGVPRLLPIAFISWFIWPTVAVFVALYDWHFFHILRPFTAGMGIIGAMTLARMTIATLNYRGNILDIRDGRAESDVYSEVAENKPAQQDSSPEDITNQLIQQFCL
ncbi:hypothetical protein QT970_03505 [Microcoleus sp. herbarium8]|uniref:hypothetical protein n=1 Tax=Microcoleus sp. herbarium8 TaxID=3055436 RepID=UPI002FD651F9